MSQANTVPPSAVPAANEGFFGKLFGLYFSPGEAFRSIMARPMLWAALAAWLVVYLAFTGVWMQKVNHQEFMRYTMEESGEAAKMTPEELGAQVRLRAPYVPLFSWVIIPVMVIIMTVLIALVFLLVFKVFSSSDLSFKQSWAIVLWTFLATGLVTTPLTLLVMGLKGEWSIDPGQALMAANAAGFLDKAETPKPLYALASSFDVFSFWMIFLLSTGYAVATRRSVGSAAAAVIGAWAVAILIKVGWAALMG